MVVIGEGLFLISEEPLSGIMFAGWRE